MRTARTMLAGVLLVLTACGDVNLEPQATQSGPAGSEIPVAAADEEPPASEPLTAEDGFCADEATPGSEADDNGGVEVNVEDGVSIGGDGGGDGGGVSVGESGVSVEGGQGDGVTVGEGGISIERCFGDIEVGVDSGDITISGPDGTVSISPEEAVEELGGAETDAGIEIPLPDAVLFDFDSAAPRATAGEQLSLVAGLAASYPDATIDIGGHTDSVGDEAYNLQLSLRTGPKRSMTSWWRWVSPLIA